MGHRTIRSCIAAVGLFMSAIAASAVSAQPAATPSLVSRLSGWAVASGDNQGQPYAIIDKAIATVFIFAADGSQVGSAPALIGIARGDDTLPGIGDMPLSKIPLSERTTPAGRFVAFYGPIKGGEETLWVDYDSALALHPVVKGTVKDRRAARLASPTPADNRITFGCINVPHDFWNNVVRSTFAPGSHSVFYILPDTKRPEEVFPALQAVAQTATQVAANDGN